MTILRRALLLATLGAAIVAVPARADDDPEAFLAGRTKQCRGCDLTGADLDRKSTRLNSSH